MELVPQPLSTLLRRMLREPEAQGTLYDLPLAKAWRGAPEDLSRVLHGERVSTPLGPASGPHTQLAQNLALAFLGGGRVMELKTVQINDRLTIPRPCIDAANVCYNVEWSQELRIEESADEYAKAAILLAALRRLGLPEGLDHARDGDFLLDLSLGYDLAGIQSPPMRAFIAGMMDAGARIDRLLSELPPDLASLRDLSPRRRLVSSVTLSTFHGCPAHEIEKIAEHLMVDWKLHVVVKLNPTLLGYEDATQILHERLGYRELTLRRGAFEKDLQWPDALAMIGRLREVARRVGVGFGVKLTNTMIVDNHKSFFADREMYLSGQPLHALASELLARLYAAIPAGIVYSFSAGIDQHNFADAAALDLCPITVCTDLLRPGGYARAPKYLDALAEAMRAAGARDVPSYVRASGDLPARARIYADRVQRDARYAQPKNAKTPKKIGSTLALFDCVSCDKCVPVCPNDANFAYSVRPGVRVAPTWRVEGARLVEGEPTRLPIEQEHQLATFVDACNACGNCDVFCPEDGGPYNLKPHWFGSAASFEAGRALDGFFAPSRDAIVARVGGETARLELDRAAARGVYDDGRVRLELELGAEGPRLLGFSLRGAPEGHTVRGERIAVLAALLDGVLSTVNPVSAGLP